MTICSWKRYPVGPAVACASYAIVPRGLVATGRSGEGQLVLGAALSMNSLKFVVD